MLWFLLLAVFYLLHLEFVDIVGCELVLHQILHQLHVHLLRSLLFTLERFLLPAGWGNSFDYLRQHFPGGRVAFLAVLHFLKDGVCSVVIAFGVDGSLATALSGPGAFDGDVFARLLFILFACDVIFLMNWVVLSLLR